MTDERRTDTPHDAGTEGRDTHLVERETYVERERPVATAYAAPPPSSNVIVRPGSPGGVETAPGPLSYAGRVISLLFGILVVLLGLRVLLLLLVANSFNAIVDFVYGVTEPFVAPFRGVFSINQVSPGGGSVFDIAALVALVGWLLIYLLLMAILRLGSRDQSSTV
jgi:uncharacterized protein YggT (Ycf19 family)